MCGKLTFMPEGVCCRTICIEMDGGIIKHVSFIGGCSGNLQGLAAMTRGQKAEDVIERLQGIKCNNRLTSCPDQLTIALRTMLSQEEKQHNKCEVFSTNSRSQKIC